MRTTLMTLTFGWTSLVSAQSITATPVNKAIVPTSSGQIGVNPVSMYPEQSYHALHAHTQYWDQESSTVKWIGVNTIYLTDLTYVSTDSASAVITKTISAAILASTATAATSDSQPGDVAFALSPKFLDILNQIAKEVESTPCGTRKRQVCQARGQAFAQRVAQELQQGRLDWVQDIPTVTVTASDIASLVNFITDARILTITSISVAAYQLGLKPVFKLFKGMTSSLSPSSGGGGNSNPKECPKTEELPCTVCAGVDEVCTRAFAGCHCKDDKCPSGPEKPECDDDKCNGNQHNVCTVDDKGCNCERDCPEAVEEWPYCDECGGRRMNVPLMPIGLGPEDGDCKGIEDNKYQYAGCKCYAFPDRHIYPYKPAADMKRALSTAADWNPPPPEATPGNHQCSDKGDISLVKDVAIEKAKSFCHDKMNNGDNWLRPRPVGGGFSNAVISYYDVDGGMIRIYAYADDACKSAGLRMVENDCVTALTDIVNQCDDKSAGGSATIMCQYYDISPRPKGNKNSPKDGPLRWRLG